MTDISASGRSATDASSVTDKDLQDRQPASPQTWLSRNAAESRHGETGDNTVGLKNTAGQRQPKIRWMDEEDEFTGMPDVFLRQDAQDSPRPRGMHKTLVLSVLTLSGLIALAAALHHRGSGTIAADLSNLASSATNGVLGLFTGADTEEDAAGRRSSPSDSLSQEQQSRARAALSEAIKARTGQQAPASAPTSAPAPDPAPAPAAEPPQAETVASSDAARKQPADTQQKTALARSLERTSPSEPATPSPSEHAAAPRLPETGAAAAPSAQAAAPKQRQHQLLPALLSFQGGTYSISIGNDDGPASRSTDIRLEPFQMARTEVTRREWLACGKDEACELDIFPSGYLDDDRLDLPVTSITLPQIEAYLAWLNRTVSDGARPFRLPTEAEWIVAARGGVRDDIAYPWGNSFSPDKVDAGFELQAAGDSQVFNGLAGILGNAQERVSDCWGAKLRSGDCFRNLGVVRGAPPGQLNETTARLSYRGSRAVSVPYSTVGFRLAR